MADTDIGTRSVKCWGSNSHGQLGLGHSESVSYADVASNSVVDLGSGVTVTSVTVMVGSSCAMTNKGMKCWGKGVHLGINADSKCESRMGTSTRNEATQMGVGDDPGEMGDNLPSVDLGTNTPVKLAMFGGLVFVSLDDG